MARRRTISVSDYPEHLNPFSELDDADPPIDEKTKYHTTGRRKSRSHMGSTWSLFASLKSKPLEASLNLSPRLPRSTTSPSNDARRKLFPDLSWLPGRRRFGGTGLASAQQEPTPRHRSSSVSRPNDNLARDEDSSPPRYRSISMMSRGEESKFPRCRSYSTMSRVEAHSSSRYRSPSPAREPEEVVFRRCRSPPAARTPYSERLESDESVAGARATWSSPSPRQRLPRSPSPADSHMYTEPLFIVEPGDPPNPFGASDRVMHRPPRPGRPKKRRAPPPPPTQPTVAPAPTPASAEGDIPQGAAPVTVQETAIATLESTTTEELAATPDEQPTTPKRPASPDAMHTDFPATPPPTPNGSYQEVPILLHVMSQEVATAPDTMSQEVSTLLRVTSQEIVTTTDTMLQEVPTAPDTMPQKGPTTPDTMPQEVVTASDIMFQEVPTAPDRMPQEVVTTLNAMSENVATTPETPPMTPYDSPQEVRTSTGDKTPNERHTMADLAPGEDTPQPIPRKPSAKARTKYGLHLECR